MSFLYIPAKFYACIIYCTIVTPSRSTTSFSYKDKHYWRSVCNDFVARTAKYIPEYSKRVNTHPILRLVDSIVAFGPTQCYNMERQVGNRNVATVYHHCYRFESFNSRIKAQNYIENRQSPSRDIATKFAILHNLRYIRSGGYFNGQQCSITFSCVY